MNLKTFALLMSILSYMCHATPISLYMNNLYPKTFGPMESFLAERRLFLEKNCPIKNGCINARSYLDALEKGLDK